MSDSRPILERTWELALSKTLIVDDSAAFRRTVKEILLSEFPTMSVAEAADGKEAFERIHAGRPDFIFMDVRLPGENGFDLTRRIKARYPEALVVMVTNYDMPEYREAARQSGAQGFLSKGSSTAKEIVAMVGLILSGKGAGIH